MVRQIDRDLWLVTLLKGENLTKTDKIVATGIYLNVKAEFHAFSLEQLAVDVDLPTDKVAKSVIKLHSAKLVYVATHDKAEQGDLIFDLDFTKIAGE